MRRTRFNIAKPDITAFFEGHEQRVFRRAEIAAILVANRGSKGGAWRLTESITVEDFLKLLSAETKMGRAEFAFAARKEIRYTWGDVPLFELVLSLKPNCYLSHYTAMHLHDLTEQIPKTIYANHEQPPKPKPVGPLQQDRIGVAFRRPARITKNVARYKERRICILNGKQTGNLGVVTSQGSESETIRVTNVERTLIDIAVRPVYAGGIFEVLGAYQRAKGKVSLNRLAATLKKLDYIYPYHQVVGFYLDKSGVYKEAAVERFRQIGLEFDFYLAHEMKETDYSEKWRLFFPKSF